MVQLRSGAKLANVWVDGQRGAYTNYRLEAVNVQLMGGDGTTLADAKISNSQGWTNVQVFGTYENLPCAGATVSGNVVTAYSSHHYRHGAVGPWTDGLSVACERAVVENNGIVDATDVGIVLFRAHPAVQASVVRDNQVLNAGNSAYAALGVDGLHSQGIRPDFTGAELSGNSFWTAPDTHVDFGITVGTRPWFGNLSDPGTGVTIAGNHTGGLQAVVGTGIAVSGMYRATVRGNDLSGLSVQPIGGCPHAAIAIDADGYAEGGDIQPGGTRASFTNPSGGGCVGH
jgi:hypothetical protein